MKEPEGYASASEVVRNLSQITAPYAEVLVAGRFRVIAFEPPYVGGFPFWVVNDRGFLWEPAETQESAEAYLETDEAIEYNTQIE